MPVSLQSSQTLKNLMRAYAGESQARNRYTFAAELCQKQQLHVLSAVFTFTANQEKEHGELFYQHMKEAAGQKITIDGDYPVDLSNDVASLLRMAHDSEYAEFQTVYPAFSQTAREEGFGDIAALFDRIAQIERSHGDRFARCADLLERGELFVAQCGWMCLNCGHILDAAQAPERCPVCGHDRGFFIRLDWAPCGGEGVVR